MRSIEHFIKEKVNTVFLSEIGFGQDIKIVIPGGKTLRTVGSLQADNIIGRDLRKIQEHTHKLFVNYPLKWFDEDVDVYLNPGMKITVNDVSYEIVSVSDELGIAEINLMRKV